MKTTIWILALLLLSSSAHAELTLINPCRILDTREPGEGPALVGQTTRDIMVRGVCGIPEDARSITYNTTIVGAAAPGFLTLYPGDEVLPTASSLNFATGEVEGNAGVVKLGATEPSLSAYLATDPPGSTAHLVLDVTGYHGASLATAVDANTTAIAGKADQSAVDANTTAIAGKADQSAVDANTTAIAGNTTAIAGKADQSAVTGMGTALARVILTNRTDIADNAAATVTALDAESNRIDVLAQFHTTPTPTPAPTPTPEDPCLNGAEWNEHGDGTVTQCSTGLMWEMKTDDGSVHDVGNQYTWTATSGGANFDGTILTVFLEELNTPPGFAGYTDWRVPTIEELSGRSDYGPATGGIVDFSALACGYGLPCTTIPGETRTTSSYWSSSTISGQVPPGAWIVWFRDGDVYGGTKTNSHYVRAVRGGS